MDCPQHELSLLALDIGGANLKAADGRGYAVCQPFPLWQRPRQLPDALHAIIAGAPGADRLVVTMTGELADCYRTKAEGVARILAAVAEAGGGRPTWVYRIDGRFAPPAAAAHDHLAVAAANWHALASFSCRYVTRGVGLLVDIGSTTTDLIPLTPVRPIAQGLSDPERLLHGELVYTGVQRSPVCGIVDRLPWRGQACPVANELFATAADAYVTLGLLHENPAVPGTADGRGLTRQYARDRLARSICADRTMFDDADARAAAHQIRQAQLAGLEAAARAITARLPARPATVVISGTGEFLARELTTRLGWPVAIVSLTEKLGPQISRAATAHALAVLARAEVPS